MIIDKGRQCALCDNACIVTRAMRCGPLPGSYTSQNLLLNLLLNPRSAPYVCELHAFAANHNHKPTLLLHFTYRPQSEHPVYGAKPARRGPHYESCYNHVPQQQRPRADRPVPHPAMTAHLHPNLQTLLCSYTWKSRASIIRACACSCY